MELVRSQRGGERLVRGISLTSAHLQEAENGRSKKSCQENRPLDNLVAGAVAVGLVFLRGALSAAEEGGGGAEGAEDRDEDDDRGGRDSAGALLRDDGFFGPGLG